MLNLRKYTWALAIIVFGFLAACNTETVDHKSINALSIKNLKIINDNTFSSGQPTEAQLQQLSKAGIKHIVNLRPVSELSFNEADISKENGLQYHTIPVAGAAGITEANAKLLANKLKALKGEAVLVHCGSANRVGALIAVDAVMNGQDIEQAITKGKQWGLTKLEPVVRKKIEN